MKDNVTIYKAHRFIGLPVLIGPLLLSIVTFTSNTPPASNELSGLAGFWVMGTILASIPFAARLEITETNVNSYFLHFCVTNLHASNVLVLEYGTLMRGGLGVGKGLKMWAMSNGKRKYYTHRRAALWRGSHCSRQACS